MLVLTRRGAEAIVITTPSGERITVTVTKVSGAHVRIRIDAPNDVRGGGGGDAAVD